MTNLPKNIPHCANCAYVIRRHQKEDFWQCSAFGVYCSTAKSYSCGTNNEWRGFVNRHEEYKAPEPPVEIKPVSFWNKFKFWN